MKNPKPRKDSPNQLLVEGKNDKYTVIALVERDEIVWTGQNPRIPYIPLGETGEEDGGIIKVFKQLAVVFEALEPGGRLGVIVDADTDPKKRWDEIVNWFKQSNRGVDLPKAPQSGGVVVSYPEKKARIGVWMMPDNQSAGCLEQFLTKLIPTDDRIWPYAQEVTHQAGDRGAPFWRKENSNMMAKAEIHTWLAWQKNPGAPFGKSIKFGDLKVDNDAAEDFLAWFTKLFLED